MDVERRVLVHVEEAAKVDAILTVKLDVIILVQAIVVQ